LRRGFGLGVGGEGESEDQQARRELQEGVGAPLGPGGVHRVKCIGKRRAMLIDSS
jgi:hypothetical protein